jgi:hypothetical protein
MTEINAFGDTFVGTAEGDHGVFTASGGRVFAGQIAGDCACVGVATWTNGSTAFAECDADGKAHGRVLDCFAGGDTRYHRYEHGSLKEVALLYADGTCYYHGKVCRADYAPFAALQAMVVPIKARPTTSAPHSRPYSRIRPHRPPVGPIGHCLGTRRSWRRPTPTRCALAASAISLRGPCGTATCQTNAPRVQPGRHTGGRVHYACGTTACVVHPSAICARAANPHALGERRGLRWAARVGFAPHAPPTHADARRGRVSHRAPALRPHLTHQIAMRIRRAHILERIFFDIFGLPKIWVGVGPLAGLCSSAVRSGWAGQEGGGHQEGGRRGGAGPPPHWKCCVSVALPRTRAHVIIN